MLSIVILKKIQPVSPDPPAVSVAQVEPVYEFLRDFPGFVKDLDVRWIIYVGRRACPVDFQDTAVFFSLPV